jgi:hypothetical protein
MWRNSQKKPANGEPPADFQGNNKNFFLKKSETLKIENNKNGDKMIVMYYEIEQLSQTKNVLERLSRGINPLTGRTVAMEDEESFLKHVEIGKCLAFAGEIVDSLIRSSVRNSSAKSVPFMIIPAQKSAVKLTEGKIGVNEFSRCVNRCLDSANSKKLTGVALNKRLKKLGILSEEKLPDGKTHTTINAKSGEYGFETERRTYKNEEYEKVVMNEVGKQYLLDNLEIIMAIEAG